MKIYQKIAGCILAIENCEKSGNTEWYNRHMDEMYKIVSDYAPCGSGFDSGSGIEFSESKPNKLVFYTSFHHMNENGYYDGWTDHSITVTPDLYAGFNLKISGSNRDDIRDYIHEMFSLFLEKEIE